VSGALWLYIFFTGPWEGVIFSICYLAASVVAYLAFVRSGRSGREGAARA
jgi:hypothetical protein